MSIIKRAKEQLELLETGFEEQLKGMITRGVSVPGYRLEESFGRETWAHPIEDILSMGDMMGVNLRKQGVVTPNQARKLNLRDDVVAAFSHRPKNGLKLVKDNNSKARKVFGKWQQQ